MISLVTILIIIHLVNEPWENCPMDVMLEFYWRVYQLVQREAPHWISVFHDVFHLYDMNLWKHFLVNCDNYALDTHTYQAWDPPSPLSWSVQQTCQKGSYYKQLEENNIPIIVGEWSLATDNCAMWLNGFNDNGKLPTNFIAYLL